MTSLTPYQDAARAVIAQAEVDLAASMAVPDECGMRHRVNFALSKALLLARTAECDAGFSHEQVDNAVIIALANIVASQVSTDAALDPRSPEALILGLHMLGEVEGTLRSRLGPNGSAARFAAPVQIVTGDSA